MKLGGLRFALGLHLMGMQGKPERGTWKTKQADDGIIDMFHKDETGSMAFTFKEREIVVDRWGPFPSKQYLADESYVLHEFLDEINSMAMGGNEGSIGEEDRLIELTDFGGAAIEKARSTLQERRNKT